MKTKISKTKIEKRLRYKQNPQLRELVIALKKQKDPIWLSVAKEIVSPRRKNKSTSLFQINKQVKDDEIVIVPRKVVASGKLEKKIQLAALSFSKTAEKEVSKTARIIKIQDLFNQSTKNFRVLI